MMFYFFINFLNPFTMYSRKSSINNPKYDKHVKINRSEKNRLLKIIIKFHSQTRTSPRRNVTLTITFLTLICTLLNHNPSEPYVKEVDPGADKAVLALTNGTRINLSDARKGTLLNLEGIEVTKAEDGALVYKNVGLNSNISEYSTITTPKGGQYKVILPDGTRVWLNAASSLSFSNTLNRSAVRRMKLVGEAYFEVKKDKVHPFIVMTGKQEIQVLGTHFNVSAYPGKHPIKTTLLEGSVRISAILSKEGCGIQTKTEVLLKPNQQSTLTKNRIQVTEVDPEDAVAWKNGYFPSRTEPLESIMLEISRWYNIDVVYEDPQLAQKLFGGVMSRSEELSEVLSVLEATGRVHFKVEGRKVTVTN